MIGGTIKGRSKKARIASPKRLETRQRPMAQSVPIVVASAAEASAMMALCQKLETHSGLVTRLRKCCSDTPVPWQRKISLGGHRNRNGYQRRYDQDEQNSPGGNLLHA